MRLSQMLPGAMLTIALGFSAAWAGPLPDGGITAEEMADRLKSAGFKAEITTDKNGDPLIKSAFEGSNFSVWFYECKDAGRCQSIQFASGWSKTGITADKVNEWNRTKRFGRCYLDRENDPWVEMDADLEHGATTEAVANDIDRWVVVLREFRKYIGR